MATRCYDSKKRSRPWAKGQPARACPAIDPEGSSARQPSAKHGKSQGKGQLLAEAKPQPTPPAQLQDLTDRLIECGVYEEYRQWREGYRRWREGEASGASGEGCSATTDGPFGLSQTWRDGYREWRRGGLKGARGEMEACGQRSDGPLAVSRAVSGCVGRRPSLPPIIYDVVAGADGKPACVPTEGPPIAPMLVQDFPPEAVLTVRVFRFFEDRSDASQPWEQGLLNVNSGSIFWLPCHLEPLMHSTAGAKYGKWFTIHYVQALAKHFSSAYQMCNEGYASGAKTFGSTSANVRAVTGKALPEGYFWYVSPAEGREQLRSGGWQHLDRDGPLDGDAFLRTWRESGSPMDVRAIQESLARMVEEASQRKLV